MNDSQAPETPAPPTVPPSPQTRPRWWVIALIVVVLLLAGRAVWQFVAPAPDLEPARRLIEAENYPDAKTRLKSILAYDPTNLEARVMMADVLLRVDPPDPSEALRLLDGLKPKHRPYAADVQVLRGKAERAANRPAKAEAAWRDALRLDPLVAEAGWLLIELYYTEGRHEELRELALRLHRKEPDPNDRVRLLLEPIRPDAEPLSAAGIVPLFKAAVEANPDDKFAAIAYYRAMVEDGTGADQAIPALRSLHERHPDDLDCLNALILGLIAIGDLDGVEKTLTSLPSKLLASPRLAYARGWLAQEKGDKAAAVREYEIALAEQPSNRKVLHRLKEAYSRLGKNVEAAAIQEQEALVEVARIELRGIKGKEAQVGRPGLFDEAISRRNLGRSPDPELFKKLARVRETMGYNEEALAWHRLVLKGDPTDSESREALGRLEAELSTKSPNRPAAPPEKAASVSSD